MAESDYVEKNSHGIQELIDRLKDKGVSEGERQAQEIVAKAQTNAQSILKHARMEADKLIAEAKSEALFVQDSGEQALKRAYRDIKLQLKEELVSAFSRQLQFLVSKELSNSDTLKSLLVSAAGKAQLPDSEMNIELPERAIGMEELHEQPELLKNGPLVELVGDVVRELFKSEVRIMGVEGLTAGARIELVDGSVSLDLSDEGLTSLILKHLQPRFRAILDGVVSS